MKHIVWKAYLDFQKEEKWLNEMSAKGMAMTDYSWCRYVFEESPSNEYTYRIELLKNLPTHPESMAYIRFLEESGIECVATYWRWIYLRKKASEGAFDLYSDIDSKIMHYKRIYVFESVFMWMELIVGITNLVMGIIDMNMTKQWGDHSTNIIAGCALTLLGLVFMKMTLSVQKKIKGLQREKMIRE